MNNKITVYKNTNLFIDRQNKFSEDFLLYILNVKELNFLRLRKILKILPDVIRSM